MSEARIRCPGCGAPVEATGVCRFCGDSASLDGITGRLLDSTLGCPRCPEAPRLRGLDHDGIRTDLCMACHGAWFGPGLLEETVRKASERPTRPGESATSPAHGAVEPVRYARCPKCNGGMSRVPFARKPLVIVDRCPAHGDWVDGGELGQLKLVARTRGLEEAVGRTRAPAAAKLSREERDNPLGGRRFAGESLLPPEVHSADTSGWGRRGRGGPDLLDLLGRLFGI